MNTHNTKEQRFTPTSKNKPNNNTDSSVLSDIHDNPVLSALYDNLNEEWKARVTDFISGKKTLPLLYDPFFRKFFDAELHPERLSDFISSIIGEKVTILQILSREELHIEGGSIIILDIIVKLEDGSIANVEIQKDPYAFPGQRISCYSADLLLRQYNKLKKEKGSAFSYKDMHKVYTIVIYEKTTKAFHGLAGNPYLHKGKTTFNSGINIDILNNYYLVALDVFKKYVYDEFVVGNQSQDSIQLNAFDNERLIGWLSFLVTENMSDVESVIKHFPWLEELYMEMAALKNDPDEILRASSEALAILDRNTMQYVIDEMSETIDKQQKALDVSNKQLDNANRQLDDANRQLNDANLLHEKDIAQHEQDIAQHEKDMLELKKERQKVEDLLKRIEAITNTEK